MVAVEPLRLILIKERGIDEFTVYIAECNGIERKKTAMLCFTIFSADEEVLRSEAV